MLDAQVRAFGLLYMVMSVFGIVPSFGKTNSMIMKI